MKLPPIKQHKWNYLALSFAMPVLCIFGILICGGYEPFGNARSLLYSDMYHQYYPFFVNFRQALRSGSGLLYNWDIGMGLDYLGLYSYYLASPLNLLSVLLPESWTLEYFSLLMPIKLGLASLFFAIFLKKTFHKNDLSLPLFGSFYGLCAWALGYQWNVMWLDTFALLPLVVLGTLALLQERKFLLYTVTLFLSVFSNYYIGLFTCVFVFLVFVCYQICRCRSFKRLFYDFCLMGLFTLLAIGMTAILTLPAFQALQTTQSSVNKFPTGFKLNIADENTWKGLLDAARQVAGNMGGGLTPSFKEGLPNLYCGVGTIILAFLYLTCGQIKIRDKLCCVFLLLFFVASFIIRQLDYIWHGFHFPNMIPYRFSFLFSFVMLYMAYKALLLRRHFRVWQLIIAGVLTIGCLICSDSRIDPVFLAYNVMFLTLYICILLYPASVKRPASEDKEEVSAYLDDLSKRRRFASLALAAIMAAELIVNTINFGIAFPYTSVSNYPKNDDDVQAALAYAQQDSKDALFYRMETTHSQTLNDGALNGYHGISTFTSSANVKVTSFMMALGYGARTTYNRYCFEESSPVSNLFLNLKYMIERDGNVEENPYFDSVFTSNDVTLQKNNAYLPLGFLTQVQLASLDFSDASDPFRFQNRLLMAASGIAEDVWSFPSRESVVITAENDVEVTRSSSVGYCNYHAHEFGHVVYTITADRAGFMCLDLNLPKRNSYKVHLNGEELYSESYSIPQTIAVSYVEPGDTVRIVLNCKDGEKSNMTIIPGYLDETMFRKAYDALAQSVLELTAFSSTRVEGTISCHQDGLLYTSIPQNGNWKAYCDGSEVDIVLVGDCMIGIPLSQGTHNITFLYQNQAFGIGWKITAVCALILLAATAVVYLPKRKKGKYEK